MRRPSDHLQFFGASIMIWPFVDPELQRALSMLGAGVTQHWDELTAGFIPHPTSLQSFLHSAFLHRTELSPPSEPLTVFLCTLDTLPPALSFPLTPRHLCDGDHLAEEPWWNWLTSSVHILILPIDPDQTPTFREHDWHALITASEEIRVAGRRLLPPAYPVAELIFAPLLSPCAS